MKQKELEFIISLYKNYNNPTSIREFTKTQKIVSYKQALYFLEKLDLREWYDYGVALDLGWFTDLGKQEIEKLIED